MRAFFGSRWTAGEVPTFYIDVGDINQIFVGHGIAYGRPERQRRSKSTRIIQIFERMDDVEPWLIVRLGWKSTTVQVVFRKQTIEYNLGSAKNVMHVAKQWDAGWTEIREEHQHCGASPEQSSRKRYQTAINSGYKPRNAYSFEKLQLDVSDQE